MIFAAFLLVSFSGKPTYAESYWQQHPDADVFSYKGGSQYPYSFTRRQEAADYALGHSDKARGLSSAARIIAMYLLEASGGQAASNSRSRCYAIHNSLTDSLNAHNLRVKRHRSRFVKIFGIDRDRVDHYGRRSFFGLAVSSDKRENMMNLAHAVIEHDDCENFGQTDVPARLCEYSLKDVVLRSQPFLRLTDNGFYELKEINDPYQIRPRSQNRSSVTAQELLTYCNEFRFEGENSNETLGLILLLIEADEREEARRVAEIQENAHFYLRLIDGFD